MGVKTSIGAGIRDAIIEYMLKCQGEGFTPNPTEISRAIDMSRNSVVWHLCQLRDEGRVSFDGKTPRAGHLRLVKDED